MSVSGTFVGGRRTEMEALNGAATLAWTGYGHDSRGRLQYVFADGTSDWAYLAYQNNGDRLRQVAYYAGAQQKMTRTYSHDDVGRVTGVQNGTLSGHGYGFWTRAGAGSRPPARTAPSWAYGYNARGEVVAGTNFLSGGVVMPGGSSATGSTTSATGPPRCGAGTRRAAARWPRPTGPPTS
ncbi:MAG: hypothetical protein M5U12_17565 [Verrucomicrobia bacterium]|nr:hypothetical protein [Verrucomicrobiota bacterium]